MIILIGTITLVVIGYLVGVGLVYAGKKFAVETDPREAEVREALPGNNCGACGYAGCDAMAAAIVKGEAPVNGCPVGGKAAADAIANIMGTSAGETKTYTAFVRCSGTCDVTRMQGNYIGIEDCRSAMLSGLNLTECAYGCIGLGSCAKVCPQGAIRVNKGVAEVDRNKCVGCGLCVKACPKGMIELIPSDSYVAVKCSSKDKGAQVRKKCAAGCIGCGLCAKQCEQGAISVTDNLAHIDYEKCVQCGACVDKCPAKVITRPLMHATDSKQANSAAN